MNGWITLYIIIIYKVTDNIASCFFYFTENI